jgi:hypothetical protein
MSYLTNTINSIEPDRIGQVTLDLNDLSNVSTSPAVNDALYFDGSDWIASAIIIRYEDIATFATPSTLSAAQYTASYYNTSFESPFLLPIRSTLSTAGPNVILDSLPKLTIGEKVYGTKSRYIERITVDANTKALLSCDVCLAENSQSTAFIDAQWQTSTGTALGPIVRIRRTGYNRQTIHGYISTSGSTVDVGLKTLTLSGNVAWPQSTATKNQYALTAKFTA